MSLDKIPKRTLELFKVEEYSGIFDISIQGRVIEIQQGSGFILRCPECNRMLHEGSCQLHGNVDGVADLRIKCIIDDGTGSVSAVFNQEITEQVLGKSIDECKELVPSVLMDLIRDKLFSYVFSMQGNTMRDQFGITFIPTMVEKVEFDAIKDAEILKLKIEEGGFGE